jgi:hypothetical protein
MLTSRALRTTRAWGYGTVGTDDGVNGAASVERQPDADDAIGGGPACGHC